MNWENIDTAPKNRKILLYDGIEETVGYWNTHIKSWVNAISLWQISPTHWLEYPKPPTTTKNAER